VDQTDYLPMPTACHAAADCACTPGLTPAKVVNVPVYWRFKQ
jgi:hypothetical protein